MVWKALWVTLLHCLELQPPSKSLQVVSTFWKPLHGCHKCHGVWQKESNWYWFLSVSTRWLYREGDSAIFPIAGANVPCPQVFLEPRCCWWLCLPGVGGVMLLSFFKKHSLGLCQESPSCSERLLARTVHAGMNYEAIPGYIYWVATTCHLSDNKCEKIKQYNSIEKD